MASLLNMRPGGPRPLHRGAFGLWLALATVPAAAQVSPLTSQTLFLHQAGNNYGGNYLALDAGAVWSDNILRTAGGSSDTLVLLGLSGDVSGVGGRFDYRLSSNLAVAKYLSGDFPTKPIGFLDGLATLDIVPGFFSWIARETYSQVQINVYAPASPENLVNMNFITTGPRFTVRPTLRTSVRLDALYSYLNTSSYSYLNASSGSSVFTNFDNHRYGGRLTIDRAFSEIAKLYLKGEYEKVEFKDEMNNHNFSIGTVEGGYNLVDGNRTVFDVSGGYSRLRVYDVPGTVESVGGERETLQTEEFEEPTWKLVLSRLITPTQRIGLNASQQFIDAAGAFRSSFDQAAPTIAPALLASGNPYLQRFFGANWHVQGVRTVFSISLYKSSSRYLLTNLSSNTNARDYDSKGASALLTRELSPVLRWNIGLNYEHVNQTGSQTLGLPPQSATGHGAITDLQWQVGEHLALRFIYAYSSWGGVATNQVGVIGSWVLLKPQARAAQTLPALSPTSPVSTQ